MILHAFIDTWTGRGLDYDGVYGYQCVDLFRRYVKDVLQFPQPYPVLGAYNFWYGYDYDPALFRHFTRVECAPGLFPRRGDVAIWDLEYGPYGHIAIVTCATAEWFTALSQNDPTGARVGLREYDYEHVLGWLSPVGYKEEV